MKQLILIAAVLALAACSKSEGQKVPPPAPTPEQKPERETTAGPYKVTFSGSSYTHSFRWPIAQAEGAVEYLITLPNSQNLQVTKADVKVTGCQASQVIHKIFWKPDSTQNRGYYLSLGSMFATQPQVQGTFMHMFFGLSGCKDIEISTTLTKI